MNCSTFTKPFDDIQEADVAPLGIPKVSLDLVKQGKKALADSGNSSKASKYEMHWKLFFHALCEYNAMQILTLPFQNTIKQATSKQDLQAIKSRLGKVESAIYPAYIEAMAQATSAAQRIPNPTMTKFLSTIGAVSDKNRWYTSVEEAFSGIQRSARSSIAGAIEKLNKKIGELELQEGRATANALQKRLNKARLGGKRKTRTTKRKKRSTRRA
jgi:hypothetical protein